MSTTYVICDNCKAKFKSPIQIDNLKENIIQGNITICPHCGKETLIENRNLMNELFRKMKNDLAVDTTTKRDLPEQLRKFLESEDKEG
ncbi:hypothetical protein LCGC14_1585150 [marine sediment metagenome]|uniref:Uncharacterized protein n=1 Tax=marine sediment metagenome TaxID=412755 RepID=A0A0F9KWA5_9ZZZZ